MVPPDAYQRPQGTMYNGAHKYIQRSVRGLALRPPGNLGFPKVPTPARRGTMWILL
jgi:hypothetical protein